MHNDLNIVGLICEHICVFAVSGRVVCNVGQTFYLIFFTAIVSVGGSAAFQ